MPQNAAVAIDLLAQFSIDSNFSFCAICSDDLRDTFEIHEDDYRNSICDNCSRYRLSQQKIENPPDRFRPQANFYTQQSDAGDDESLEKEVFINE